MPILKMTVTIMSDSEFPWNVQKWYSYDGGNTIVYSGFGRFCKNSIEADEYIRSSFDEHKKARAV